MSLEASKIDRIGEAKGPVVRSKTFYIARRVLGFILDNWLVIGFGLAAALGYLFPSTSNS
jgi:hypothetical protein